MLLLCDTALYLCLITILFGLTSMNNCSYCFLSLQWEEFFDQMKPVLAALPYMVCPGNHESDSKNSK